MDQSERPIASFSDEKKDAVPLPVKAPINWEYESSFDEFAGAWAKADPMFFAERGADYEPFRLAYEFGAKLASNNRFAGQSWVTAESRIRTDWQKRTDRPWEEVAPEIQRGWTEARGEG